jgi:hypothetical protein
VSQEKLEEVLVATYDECFKAVEAYRDMSTSLARQVMTGRLPFEAMIEASRSAFFSAVKSASASVEKRFRVSESQLAHALRYFAPRSDRIRDLEASIRGLEPPFVFTREECAECQARSEALVAARLERLVADLAAKRGIKPETDEAARLVNLQLETIQRDAEEEALGEKGVGYGASTSVFDMFSSLFELDRWSHVRKEHLRLADTLDELGVKVLAADLRAQVQLRDAQERQRSMQRMQGAGGMFGAM